MTIPGLTYRPVVAEFLTPSYRVVGKVLVPNAGLLSQLNDPTPSHLDVQEAQLARIHMPGKLIERYELIRVIKRQLTIACVTRRTDLRSRDLRPRGENGVAQHRFKVTTTAYEIEGVLELDGPFDLSLLMESPGYDFIPLFDVRVQVVLIPSVIIESPAAVLNRQHIDLVTLAVPSWQK